MFYLFLKWKQHFCNLWTNASEMHQYADRVAPVESLGRVSLTQDKNDVNGSSSVQPVILSAWPGHMNGVASGCTGKSRKRLVLSGSDLAAYVYLRWHPPLDILKCILFLIDHVKCCFLLLKVGILVFVYIKSVLIVSVFLFYFITSFILGLFFILFTFKYYSVNINSFYIII
jgi:hypothetical protein